MREKWENILKGLGLMGCASRVWGGVGRDRMLSKAKACRDREEKSKVANAT